MFQNNLQKCKHSFVKGSWVDLQPTWAGHASGQGCVYEVKKNKASNVKKTKRSQRSEQQ